MVLASMAKPRILAAALRAAMAGAEAASETAEQLRQIKNAAA
jgi:hypothetical protein